MISIELRIAVICNYLTNRCLIIIGIIGIIGIMSYYYWAKEDSDAESREVEKSLRMRLRMRERDVEKECSICSAKLLLKLNLFLQIVFT
jgi:hypothetical protein